MIGHNLLLSLRLDSIIIWILLSFSPSKSYLYGIEFDFDTSILTYEYKYHFHLLNQMYGTEVDFDTCILFLMLIRIVHPGLVEWMIETGSRLGSVKKYTSLSDDLYHFFGIVLCYQQPKYAFKK